jgi:hypothetical protein
MRLLDSWTRLLSPGCQRDDHASTDREPTVPIAPVTYSLLPISRVTGHLPLESWVTSVLMLHHVRGGASFRLPFLALLLISPTI